MIVCHCRGISDRAIRASIRAGASSIEALRETTGAADCCGGCEPTVERLLAQELGFEDSTIQSTGFRPLRVVRDTRAA